MKQKSLISNSVFNVAYQMLSVIFPFITAIYVSHVLMAEGVGKVAFAQNLASYFTAIAPLGVMNYGVKEIARTKDTPEQRNICFSELFLINFVSTIIATSVFYTMIFCQSSFENERMLYAVCGIPIFLNIINVDWFYRGVEEYAYITVRSLMIKIASIVLLFLTVRTANDYIQYALITSFVGSANNIFNMFYLRKFVKFRWKGLHWKRHMKSELILACNILMSNLYSKVDVTMLGCWKTDAITGYYANAFKIVNIVLCICTSMTDAFLPRLSYIYFSDKKKYSTLLNQGISIVLTIIFPAMTGLAFLAPVMVPMMFGDSFKPSVPTVMILSCLIIIKGFGNLACYQVAISSGNEKKQTIAYISGSFINIVLNVSLIPILNQNGAAIASVVSEFTLNAILFLQLRKISGISVNLKNLIIILADSAIMGIVVLIILLLLGKGFLAVAAAVLSGILVYAVVGYIIGSEGIRMIIEKLVTQMKYRKMSNNER